MVEKKHKAGFVNIIGYPNVGKSTLMNQLVGEKLSIITPKAQTTRHRILGIVNEEEVQIVFSDTPGILKPSYKMQEGMMKFVYSALEDADLILLMIECGQRKIEDEKLMDFLQQESCPVWVLLNKIDLKSQKELEEEVAHWSAQFPKADILPIAALHKFNVAPLVEKIKGVLPENPPFYPKDSLTDKSERFFVEEKIREHILTHYKQEIPYSVEVVVESFKAEEGIIRIHANIFVARNSQKHILIGKQGHMLKKVGSKARQDLEKFFNSKIFLSLLVKVKKDWRDDQEQLKRFGYLQ